MAKEIWLVERWTEYQSEDAAFERIFCFDAEHTAQAFAAKMEKEYPNDLFMVLPDDVFTHVEDAVAALKGE